MSDPIYMPAEARQQAMVVKVPGYLRHLTLRLAQNSFTPAVDLTLDDFIEADFPGYEAQSLNDFGDPYINSDEESESDTGVHYFTSTDVPDPSPQTIYGWYTEFPEGKLGPYAKFAPPPVDPEFTITASGQVLGIQILFEEGALEEE